MTGPLAIQLQAPPVLPSRPRSPSLPFARDWQAEVRRQVAARFDAAIAFQVGAARQQAQDEAIRRTAGHAFAAVVVLGGFGAGWVLAAWGGALPVVAVLVTGLVLFELL